MVFRRDRLDRELEEEMRIHREMAADEARADGLDAESAAIAAKRRFGKATLLKEDAAALWPLGWMEVRALDPRIGVAEIMTHSAVVNASLSEERTIVILCSAFGAMALGLACIGIYGLLSYGVARRIPELGVRLALGARPADVSWLVIREMLTLVGVGLLAGVPVAIGVMRFAASLLYELTPADPATLALASVVLASVATAAAYLPARRAAHVDPITALRYE